MKVETEYLAFRCLECSSISVFHKSKADGNKCLSCDGQITPIGNAKIARDNALTLHVKTEGFDELEMQLRRINNLASEVNNNLRRIENHIPPVGKNEN